MTYEKYQEQRNVLLDEVSAFITEGKLEESNAKMAEVEVFDNQYEKTKLANANLEALKGSVVATRLENKSLEIKGAVPVDISTMKTDELLASDVYRNAYLKKLQGKELSVMENAAVSAQSVIPTVTMNKIIEKLEETSVIYNKITVSFFPNKLSIPKENVKNDASWLAMATASTDSEDSFDYVTLTAYKLIKTIEIEADVQAMSIDMFEGFIVMAMAKKLNKAIENAIINGTGTNQPTGLALAGQITNIGTYTKVKMTYADILTILAALPSSYHPTSEIMMPRKLFFTDILGIVDLDGRPIVHVDVESTSKFSLLGYPVGLNDFVPTDTVIFGDLSYFFFNWAKALEISSDASVGFRSGSIVYRGLALADGKLVLPEAFTLYTRALA